jgi:hypothetical protein
MQAIESLTALEVLASIICESGGARFLRLERVNGCPALAVFCTPGTVAALPLDQLSTHNVKLAVFGEAELIPLNSTYILHTAYDGQLSAWILERGEYDASFNHPDN